MQEKLPGVIVSSPDASIYSVVDVRNITGEDFNALDFAVYCARQGAVSLSGKKCTLLIAPMAGFYSVEAGAPNPGRTQMRIAFVDTPERMKLVPELLAGLLEQYLKLA